MDLFHVKTNVFLHFYISGFKFLLELSTGIMILYTGLVVVKKQNIYTLLL